MTVVVMVKERTHAAEGCFACGWPALLVLLVLRMVVLLLVVVLLVLVVRTHQDVGDNRKEVSHRHRKIQHSG